MACQGSDDGVGLGVVHFSPNEEGVLKIYLQPEDLAPSYVVKTRYQEGRLLLYIEGQENNSRDFLPLHNGQLQGFLAFRVMEKHGAWLKIVINEESLDYGWIEDPLGVVENWTDFLGSIHHIKSLDGKIYQSADSSANFDVIKESHCLNLRDIQGDWLKVSHNPLKCNDPLVSQTGPAGFIRWKKDGKILINFRM